MDLSITCRHVIDIIDKYLKLIVGFVLFPFFPVPLFVLVVYEL